MTLVTLDARQSHALTSLRNDAADAFAPVQSAIGRLVSPVTGFFQGVFEYRSLRDENARLREVEAQQANAQVAALDAQRERQDLLDLLNLSFVGDIPTVAARVIGGPTSNFQQSLMIDQGSDDGLLVGMPVVAAGGLSGRLERVTRSNATVLLLTDPSFAVGIRLSPSGAVGVATGQGAGRPMSVEMVDPSSSLPAGLVAATSGLALSAFPPSIPVGRVLQDPSKAGPPSRDLRLAPVVDLNQLTFVEVLLWTPH